MQSFFLTQVARGSEWHIEQTFAREGVEASGKIRHGPLTGVYHGGNLLVDGSFLIRRAKRIET